MYHSCWKPGRRRGGWPNYFNQKNCTRQTIDRRRLARGTPVVQLGQIPNNTANCFEKIVTSTNLLTPKEEQPPTKQSSQMKRDLSACPLSCSHLCQWASFCPLMLISRHSGF